MAAYSLTGNANFSFPVEPTQARKNREQSGMLVGATTDAGFRSLYFSPGLCILRMRERSLLARGRHHLWWPAGMPHGLFDQAPLHQSAKYRYACGCERVVRRPAPQPVRPRDIFAVLSPTRAPAA